MPDAPTPTETPFDEAPFDEAPFVVEHRRQPDRGGFVPSARLVLTPALRTSGLWAALPPDALRDLLLLMTFLTPNGWIRPTLPELAEAMAASPAQARERMARLAGQRWQGEPVAALLPRENGLDAYAPARRLLAQERPAPDPGSGSLPLPWRTAGREAVLAYSRFRYARKRQEVEAEIAARMGWAAPSFADEAPETAARKQAAYAAMTDLGLPKPQVLDLLARFDLERVERQVAWIGRRNAKNPGRFLAAAIERDYEAPWGLRTPGSREDADAHGDTAHGESGDVNA